MSNPVADLRYDTLISAPGILADLLRVPYRKAARGLNVKQLRESFWKVLTKSSASQHMESAKSFRELYTEVLPHLTEKNKVNMNLPIAFVTTLSLCNEKHLVLTAEGDSSDFSVSQAPIPLESFETNLSSPRPRARAK